MANYCWNCVSFYGKTKQIKELVKRLKSYEDFNYLNAWGDYVCKIKNKNSPYNYEEDQRPYYFYGTKWWDFEIINEEKNEILIQGDSAWSPPIELVEKICKVYDLTAEIEYDEPGMDFAGISKFNKNGVIYEEQMISNQFRYKNNKDYWFEDLIYAYDGNSEIITTKDFKLTFEKIQEEHPYASKKDILKIIESI